MKVLLIGGAPNTGKSNAVTMCANYLLNKNFKVIDCIDGNEKKLLYLKLPQEQILQQILEQC